MNSLAEDSRGQLREIASRPPTPTRLTEASNPISLYNGMHSLAVLEITKYAPSSYQSMEQVLNDTVPCTTCLLATMGPYIRSGLGN